jgi:4-amino-4-deoxy-L-arabinose transferase-like glycosyltransferase
MLEEGDFIRIRFQDQPRHKKPAGIYWLQAASAAAFSQPDRIWPYRLPSVLGALAAVLLTFSFGKRFFDPKAAFLGAALLASSLLLIFEAHQATTDAALLATVLAAQGSLGYVYVNKQKGRTSPAAASYVFWAAQGMGILIKGPMLPLVSVMTILGLWAADKSASWLRELRIWRGLLLMLVIACPWMVAVALATQGSFFTEAIGQDLFPKITTAHESHGAPAGIYLLLMTATFWPGSFFAWQGLVRAWKQRLDPRIRFLLAWIIPVWLVLEIMPTKLPHYVMPVYPALALLTAWAIYQAADKNDPKAIRGWAWAALGAWSLVWLLLMVGAVALPLILDKEFSLLSLWPALVGTAVLAWFWIKGRKGPLLSIGLVSVLGAALMLGPVFQGILPSLKGIWLSKHAQDMVNELAAASSLPASPLAVVGYNEPSVVFHLGTDTRMVSSAAGAQLLAKGVCAMALVTDAKMASFKRELAKAGMRVRLHGSVRSHNYTKGKWLTLNLCTAEPNPSPKATGKLGTKTPSGYTKYPGKG